jgi:EAL domain-containing protein (putative c-di-GMP-specific phosphodiesterase class I)
LIENSALALANLKQLSRHGIAISIDDYGSGMSSLAYVRDLPAQELKIDKMFISGMTTSHRDPLIVRSTIDLAHALDLEVVAEGVESPAALALLRVMGCDFAQGFLISPALAIDKLEAFLEAYVPNLALGGVTMTPPPTFWQRTRREPDDVAAVAG